MASAPPTLVAQWLIRVRLDGPSLDDDYPQPKVLSARLTADDVFVLCGTELHHLLARDQHGYFWHVPKAVVVESRGDRGGPIRTVAESMGEFTRVGKLEANRSNFPGAPEGAPHPSGGATPS